MPEDNHIRVGVIGTGHPADNWIRPFLSCNYRVVDRFSPKRRATSHADKGAFEGKARGVRRPSLTLGIPVFNGMQGGVVPLIESLLADDFDDFELIVSDNGSTDGTWDALGGLARSDSRMRLNRFEDNRGVIANFNHLLETAAGDLFKWCAVGDVIRPDFLTSTVGRLRASPECVIAHSRYDFTDGLTFFSSTNDDRRFFDDAIIAATHSAAAVRRVCGAIEHHGYGGHLYGVIRTAAARRCGMHPDRSEGDRILLARLAAQGRFAWDERVLWSCHVPIETLSPAHYRFPTDVEGSIERHVLIGGWLQGMPRVQRLSVASFLGARILSRKAGRLVRRPVPGDEAESDP